jgi:hypothetical protein
MKSTRSRKSGLSCSVIHSVWTKLSGNGCSANPLFQMGWNSRLRSRGEHQLETGSKRIPIKECAGKEHAPLRDLGSNAWMAY